MSRDYFELDDPETQERWYLGGVFDNAGTELDSREFTYGRHLDVAGRLSLPLYNGRRTVEVTPPLFVPIEGEGTPLDFTFAEFEMPVVAARVADLIESIARSDVQRIPVTVESHVGLYEIINVTCRLDCIDTNNSKIQWYAHGNDIRPDLAGTPEMVTKLVIDPRRVEGHHMFRPTGWEVALIVSDVVKDAFERTHVTGVTFRKVTGMIP